MANTYDMKNWYVVFMCFFANDLLSRALHACCRVRGFHAFFLALFQDRYRTNYVCCTQHGTEVFRYKRSFQQKPSSGSRSISSWKIGCRQYLQVAVASGVFYSFLLLVGSIVVIVAYSIRSFLSSCFPRFPFFFSRERFRFSSWVGSSPISCDHDRISGGTSVQVRPSVDL